MQIFSFILSGWWGFLGIIFTLFTFLFYYFLTHPEKIEKWIALISKFIFRWNRFFAQHYTQSIINDYYKNISKKYNIDFYSIQIK